MLEDANYSYKKALAANKRVKEKNYWLNKLSGELPKSVLPPDLKKTADAPPVMEKEGFRLNESVCSMLLKVSGGVDHTLHMILLAGVEVLLHKYTGSTDILIGMPVYRQEGDVQYINTRVALRNRIDGRATFKELLLQVRQTVIEAVENLNYPIEVLREDLNLSAAGTDLPLFYSAVLLENIHDKTYIDSLKLNIIYSFKRIDKYIEGSVEYDSTLYRQSTIGRLISHLQQLLTSALNDLDSRVYDIELLSAEEKKQIIFTFNHTGTDYPQTKTIHGFITGQAEKIPDQVAIKAPAVQMTYRELQEKSDCLAYELIEKGVLPDSIVGIMMERSVEMIIGIMGILKSGGAYLPIDPGYPKERIDYMLKDSNTGILINKSPFEARSTKSETNPNVQKINDPNKNIEDLTVLYLDHLNFEFVSDFEFRISNFNSLNLAYVIYTSGSTGRPKGVLIEHHSVINRLNWMQRFYPLAGDDTILQKTPFIFDVSVWELFWWAMYGAAVCLPEPGAEKEPGKLVQAIERNKITTMHFVPSMLNVFLEYIEGIVDLKRLAALKRVFASGEALGLHHVETFNRLLNRGNGTKLINLYGPTEATVDVSYYNCNPNDLPEIIPIGKPIDNIFLYILNNHMQLQPVGVPGELCISGVGLARGYLNRPELTAEKFKKYRSYRSNMTYISFYKTGDLARWLEDGNIEFLGRLDQQVKIRGFRIELEEIENSLLKHKEIKEAVVLALDNAGGAPYLCAYFAASVHLSVEMIREFLSAQLPGYMLPSHFIQVETMPHLPTGKIDRKGLPKVVAQGEAGTFVPPATPGEKALAEIWEDVLKAEQVGIDDNFFRLGGDSIRSIQVVSKAHARGLHFTSRELFLYPSIRGLLQNIARNQPSSETGDAQESFQRIPFNLISPGDRVKIPAGIEDAYPLTMLQAGLVFHSELSSGTALYHDIASYRLQGRFHRRAFEDALKYVIKRHNILRTTYDLHNFSQYLQLVHREVPLPLQIENLEGIPGEKQEEILTAFMETEKSWRFDWGQPGLIRFIIHVLGDEVFQYTLSIHDSTLDGWSMSSLNTELFQAYFALTKGQTIPGEPSLKAFYRDYVHMELEALKQEEQKKYWQELLLDSTFTELARWPLENPHEEAIEVCFHKVDISPGLSDGLNELARSLSVPLKSVLLAAHMRVISVFSGSADVLTGIEHNGRPEITDGEKILGLFLNTLPFRVKLAGGTWGELFQVVYNAEMDLLPYRNYPMARIRQERNGQPLFETVFNYTNFYVMKNLEEIDTIQVLATNGVLETDFPFRSEFRKGAFTDEIELDLHYNKYIFCKEHIQAVSRYYSRVLHAISNNSLGRYEALTVLNEVEQREFLEKMNDTRSEYPEKKCFHDLFEAQAARTPAKVAVLDKDRQWTYKELNAGANLLAKELVKRGAGPGTIVAAALTRSFELLNIIIAIFKAQAVYLPLEVNSPAERISYILEQSRCYLVLTANEYLPALSALTFSQAANSVREIIPLELLSKNEGNSSDLGLASSPQNLAYVIYTSGSTGIPKGVMIEHRGMLNHLYSKLYALGITDSDTIAQNASHCFDISVWQFLAALLVGGVTAIYSNEIIMEPALFMNQLVKNCVTIFEVVPSYLSIILEIPGLNSRDFRVPRWLIVTGEELKPEPVTRWYKRFPGIKMVNAYGPTEASDDITHFILDKAPDMERIPIGKPLGNLNIYIVDNYMQLCPIGVKGEICVSGVGVGRGYLHDDNRTHEVFLEDPFAVEKGVRFYKTGDVGCWLPDGNIVFFGRKDHQVKIRGFRIELGEIESRLAEHPQVKEAVVLDKEDEKGNKFLCAYMVLGEVERDNGHDFDLAKLKAFLSTRLPDYMLPSHFVFMENLPLTPNGKIDRKAFPDPGKDSDAGEDYEPPANEDEEKLVNIWSQVLGIPENQIGVEHHFFDLGGNSIMLMSLANLINKHYSARLKIMDFFHLTTIRQLARYLGTSTKKTGIEEFEL